MADTQESQFNKDADRLALLASWIRQHLEHMKVVRLRPWHIRRIGLSINQLSDDEIKAFLGTATGEQADVHPRMTAEEVEALEEQMQQLYRELK